MPSASRRENVVELTPLGERLVEKGAALVLAETERVLAPVPPHDFTIASRAIRAMIHANPDLDDTTEATSRAPSS